METNIEKLVRQYEALWENDAPMEQIVEFCRCHSQEEENENAPLLRILSSSLKWGEMVFMPSFLKHLTGNDDYLLHTIGYYYRSFHHETTIQRILSMKKGLPDRIRAFFWALMKKSGRNALIDIMLLVDDDNVRDYIVEHKIGCYERIPAGLTFVKKRQLGCLFTEEVRKAIAEDSVSLLELGMTLSGKRVTTGLLLRLLVYNAWNILLHLLKHRAKQVTSILSPHDLLISICAYGTKSNAAVKVLDALEELSPGVSKSTDGLGNTPLWYCLYHRSPSDELVQALIRHGCDPDQRNHLNLSYRICAEAQKLTWEP